MKRRTLGNPVASPYAAPNGIIFYVKSCAQKFVFIEERRVEQITQKEFYAKYASKTCKGNIAGASAFAYIYAAVILGAGIFMRGDYSAVPYVALTVVLALGVQAAKSRVCAVALMLYACYAAVMATMTNGRFSGWLLAAGGIFAVRGTFGLHKEYMSFMRRRGATGIGGVSSAVAGARRAVSPSAAVGPGFGVPVAPKDSCGQLPAISVTDITRTERKSEAKAAARMIFVTVLPFVGMFIGMCLIYLSLRPEVLRMLTDGAQSPESLLRAYRDWYIILAAAVAAAALLPAACIIFSACRGIVTAKSVQIMVLSLAFPLCFGGFMLVSEDVPSLILQADEDIRQIRTGQLKEVTVWLSPKSRSVRLPGPYAQGQPEPVTRYGGIGWETDGKWVHFYVPKCLGFALNRSALYDENKSIEWNIQNAVQYRILYTENFNLVVGVKPVKRWILERKT